MSFFPRDVLDEILNLIETVSEGFSTYSSTIFVGCGTLFNPSAVRYTVSQGFPIYSLVMAESE